MEREQKFISFIRVITISLIICVLSILLFACASNTNSPDNKLPDGNIDSGNQSDNYLPDDNIGDNIDGDSQDEVDKHTHTVKVNNKNLFDYYFTFSSANDYLPNFNFEKRGPNGSSIYGTKSASTITITPKLTGFVDYSGYVEFKPETESNNKSAKVLKNRRIDIEYWGSATDIYEVTNEKEEFDNTISFDDIDYKFYAVDIVVTYHHEGLSGNKSLSYETIYITKYNHKSYLTINIENKSYYTTSYHEYDYNHRNPIYTYHYYQTYTITPTSQIGGYKEFNNIKLTFDNGTIIALDALGKATYKSEEYSVKRAIPKLSNIIGCIDFYPPAEYKY